MKNDSKGTMTVDKFECDMQKLFKEFSILFYRLIDGHSRYCSNIL